MGNVEVDVGGSVEVESVALRLSVRRYTEIERKQVEGEIVVEGEGEGETAEENGVACEVER